ncbi:PREDICTED: uncharacterized protein LOC104753076 [Camelina sativa]|uniref:Uncharacterized protein LOC104753076 n=1 Tax=Camelina sativa TaxID=90675 RepID=A0ABM0WNH9_CAMSA|nr:PREDICTED: uncharacterized protein LOC104753076 [Camelina sativa]
MATKFDMSDLGRLTYYLGIEVCQFEGGIILTQQQYAKKILEQAGMKDCNRTLTPLESGLKLAKAEGEKDIDATSFRKNFGCLRYLLHTRPDLTYCVGVLSRYMQTPKVSHGAAMKQNQDTVALSSCKAEFMAGTEAARHAIWLQDLLEEVTCVSSEKVTIRVDNKSAIALTKNPVFYEVEHVLGHEQKADILTNALGRIKFKEMRELIGVKDLEENDFKLRREIVDLSLKKA